MASPLNTVNFPTTPNRPVISLPDTPSSRLLIDNWERQKARRQAAQHVLFTGISSPPSTPLRIPERDQMQVNVPTTGLTAKSTTPFNNSTQNQHSTQAAVDPEILITEGKADDVQISPAPFLDKHITSQIIAGCSSPTHVTNTQAFEICMATTNLRIQFPTVSEAKKNRSATTPALFHFILANEKRLKLPTYQEGSELRSILRSFTAGISAEYHTNARINSEMILCALNNMDVASSKCFLSQFHRGISCTADQFAFFEDECAAGKISQVAINYTQPIELTFGFSLFSDSEASDVYLIRLTTAMTDFMSYVSNSDLQKQFGMAFDNWKRQRLTNDMISDRFAVNEEEAFAVLQAAGAAACRSVPDELDRGLAILSNLPLTVRAFISKTSMKRSVPENMMNRNWVISQIKRIETESKPKYSWHTNTTATQKQCNNFQNGNCTYGTSCRFQHTMVQSSDSNTSLITAPTGPSADDISIECSLKHSPKCTATFKVSPSYYATLKTADGTPYDLPKSCKSCRDLKRFNFKNKQSVSMFTCEGDTEPDFDDSTEQHDNDGADDDYYTEYSMCMSDV
jgi:hypothetical protein